MKVFLSFLFVLTLLLAAPNYSQVTIHIPGDYSTIQEGINAAVDGDIVLVADGTYYENINFRGKAITVTSHFYNGGDETHIENTIIDGSQPIYSDSASVVSFISGEDTASVICGFTITGGTGNFYTTTPYDVRTGGGITVFESGANICNNIVEYNSLTDSIAYGGGILVHSPGGDITIINNNIIRNNSVAGTIPFGGGISLFNNGITFILSNKIIDNEATGDYATGGGIDIEYANDEIVINSNYIKGNDTQLNGYGGGGINFYEWEALITVSNNLIVDNIGFRGGGVLVDVDVSGSSKPANLNVEDFPQTKKESSLSKLLEDIPVLVNNTIYNNTAELGGGIYCWGFSPDIMNSIVWGNTYTSGGQIGGTAATVTYSDVEGGFTGTGNIDCNPGFLDTTYFLLSDSSCCIDSGNPDPMYNDIEDPNNPGFALYPAMETLRNDMGTFGGPNSTWSLVLSDTLYVPSDYSTIQAAIDAAINGNVVLVAEDTYYENINFKGKAITVASHFLVDGNETHIENTIIDGSQPSHSDSGSVVYFTSGEDTTSALCGFTITGGTGIPYGGGRVGGGIIILFSSPIIKNNIIRSNEVIVNENVAAGSAIFYQQATGRTVIIENNIIDYNLAQNTGSAISAAGTIFLWGSTITTGKMIIRNNIISDNIVTANNRSFGGAIAVEGQNHPDLICYIENNKILRNEVTGTPSSVDILAGGLSILRHQAEIRNNIIAYNSARRGGGIFVWDNTSPPPVTTLLENTTIYGNIGTQNEGAMSTHYEFDVLNCIIWGNSSPQFGTVHNATINYSDIEEYYSNGDSNITAEPMFLDELNDDFHLQDVSLCIGAGIDSIEIGGFWHHCPITDIDGNPRPNPSGSMPDMGAYESPLENPVSVEDDLSQIPVEYSLAQNYPNPFNPTTTIIYGLRERTNVELKVYDVLGREVETIVNGEQNAGFYEMEFNASRLASGIYFYRLQTGDPSAGSGQGFVETKKMLLMK